ncbi:hypothetical protein HJG60_000149 [Phyllostomus discolor]|uniref:E3 ubiquitin-protein ligase RNF213 n=1 Tax=Phyllostomus discolor TaxID=89673 RepID=A0A834DQA2_9CHIR|nr:hypothetical protein HJG60_000149 [Phyllostomus discolor]
MACPSCGHVPGEDAAKFCSQCGQRLPGAVPAPATETSVTSVPEGEMELGQELKEEGGPFPSLGSGDGQESLAESGSWTTQKSKSKSKSRRERRKRKNQRASASVEPESSSLCPSLPCSLDPPAPPASQDAALPPRPGQPCGPPGKGSGAGATPGGRGGSLPGRAAGVAEADTGGESPGSAAPQGPTGGGALPEGKGREGAGPTPAPAASEGGPGKEAAARELPPPPPETDGAHPEPGREPPATTGQRAAAPASGATAATAKTGDPGKGAKEEVQNETPKSKQPPASVPAPREHQQETEAKGETAVAKEKAKPQAPKKAAQAPGQDVAASKEKARKDQKADSQAVPESPLRPGEGVSVFFRAIISKHFGFEPSHHQVFVRGGEELGEPRWQRNVCEMHCIRDLEAHGYLVEGRAVISKQHLDKPIPYKYVVNRGKDGVEYEFIYEKQKEKNTHVNRCLHVRSKLLGAEGWHQYDDIVCKRSLGKIQKVVDFLTDQTRKDIVRGKKIATAVMLDSLFGALRPWGAAGLDRFFVQFRQFYSVVRAPVVHEAGERPWSSLQYEEKQVKEDLWEHLKTRVAPFLQRAGDPLPADFPVQSKLRLGLVVLRLAQEFQLPAFPHDLPLLCDLLCCSACSPSDFHADLSHILETPQRWREALAVLCLESVTHGVGHWVGVLPVLHRCMERPTRRGDSRIQHEETWAALEGVPFKEFREKKADGKKLLQLMRERKSLLDLDESLFRSWFSVLPLSSLVPFLQEFTDHRSRFLAHILDCLQGTVHRLQELREVSKRNVEDVKDTLKMLLQLLDKFRDSVPEKTSLQPYLTACLELHKAVCKLTKEHVFHELPALSAEAVLVVTALKPLADAAAGRGSEIGQSSVRTVVQTTLNTTRSWLRGIFSKSMFQSSQASLFTTVTFTYEQEVQVWRRLVEIDFPAEHGWKESLLRDMEGRLKQENPRFQISAFCSTDWKGMDAEDSVAKCFESCVIEAVSLACQVSTLTRQGLVRGCGCLPASARRTSERPPVLRSCSAPKMGRDVPS